jgi:hypothetical protein
MSTEHTRRGRRLAQSHRTVLAAALAAALVGGACTAGAPPQPEPASGGAAATIPQPEVTGLDVAPEGDRVDLAVPTFTHPATITNPLFPVLPGESYLQLGTVDGKPFRAEVTTLGSTRPMLWNGTLIETVVSQYVALMDGRVHEVALDHYAQDDAGNVWYFGEDVSNYKRGFIADTEGTWSAGRDGPAAMIMPADPQVGDVYRPENVPGVVFEEVTVKATGRTVEGPRGPVSGAVEVLELHMDGATEDKTFAPGYGEFFTGGGGDSEAMAVMVPTDALGSPVPGALMDIGTGATEALGAAGSGRWPAAAAALAELRSAADTVGSGDVPPLLEDGLRTALRDLSNAIDARDSSAARLAAIWVGHAGLDLELRHRPPAEIDLARLGLWARQTAVDIAGQNRGDVTGDLAMLTWVRDRVVHAYASLDVSEADRILGELRIASHALDAAAAEEAVDALTGVIAGMQPLP